MEFFTKLRVVLLLCLAVYLTPQVANAGDLEKANQQYNIFNYKLAIELYEKVMAKKPSLAVAQKIANCHRFMNNTDAAEIAFAKVISFNGFDPINYYYYADVLKQNGKFDLAKYNYNMYGSLNQEKFNEATMLAASCDSAKLWAAQPNKNILVKNNQTQNSEYSDFSPIKYDKGFAFVSDRLNTDDQASNAVTGENDKIYGWTGNGYLKLYEIDTTDKESPVINRFPGSINSKYHNGPVTASSDFNELYFSRTDISDATKDKKLKVGQKFIYYSQRKGGAWSEATLVPFNKGEDFSVQHPALSPDGTTLYFSSDMPGGYGGLDLYASRKLGDGTWGKPENCGTVVNTSLDEVFPSVAANNMLYFSSRGHYGLGGLDLFSAEGSYTSFSNLQNLKAPYNSTKDDFGILFLDKDNGLLSSNRSGGLGLDDIYRFRTLPSVVEMPVFAVEGKIVDHTGAPVNNAVVALLNKTTGKTTGVFTNPSGQFHFDLDPENDFTVRADSKMSFVDPDEDISTKGLDKSKNYNILFTVRKPLDTKDVYVLKNIYYDFDKYELRKDALVTLFKLAVYLKKYPNVNIELRSHTDERGTPEYNQELSQKRADAAVAYLIRKGIKASRLTAKGYGETELIFICGDSAECPDSAHQVNRRTEFKVLK